MLDRLDISELPRATRHLLRPQRLSAAPVTTARSPRREDDPRYAEVQRSLAAKGRLLLLEQKTRRCNTESARLTGELQRLTGDSAMAVRQREALETRARRLDAQLLAAEQDARDAERVLHEAVQAQQAGVLLAHHPLPPWMQQETLQQMERRLSRCSVDDLEPPLHRFNTQEQIDGWSARPSSGTEDRRPRTEESGACSSDGFGGLRQALHKSLTEE